MTGARLPVADIDPLAATPRGRYEDERVTVCRGGPVGPATLRTAHFGLRRVGRRVELTHGLHASELDNDLAELLEAELFAPGWLAGVDLFERLFTGVVMSTVDDPVQAWSHFYRNTMTRIAATRPVYQRAVELIGPGHVLDVNACFGFLALRLAARSRTTVIATDGSPGSMRLLDRMAGLLGTPVRTLICDPARVPLPDDAVDTVSLVHVLEHLEPEHGEAVVSEAVRLARKRIVVAVPIEEQPNAAYGHLRTFTRDDLDRLGAASGLRHRTGEYHSFWLTLDR
jgi:hypothetical protein